MRKLYCLVLIITLIFPSIFINVNAEPQEVEEVFSSEKYDKGYRYNTNGWIYLHIQGDAYERGYQHGYLLADEILDHIQRWIHIFPQKLSWKVQRFNANRFFWNKYPKEYQDEIKGIADGCADRGKTIYGKAVSYKDILALNEMYEMLSRFRNYYVQPLRLKNNWLVSILFSAISKNIDIIPSDIDPEIHTGKCSAFIATGDATIDGRIVASHNTRGLVYDNIWWHMYVTERWNLLLDIKPSRGHRVLISTAPGMIWSDEDFYQNDAGMILMETTLPLGIWNRFGLPLVVRARTAIQYSESIDEMVDYFLNRNNGLFANEWVMGDTKTGEIASLELALFNHKLKRTKNGFYYSVNAAKDDKVRWELFSIFGLGILGRIILPKYQARARDIKFEEIKEEYYGKIDVDLARKIMSTYPICDVLDGKIIMFDCKVTDSELVDNFGLWAFMGNPGHADFESEKYPIHKEREEYVDSPACGWVQIYGRDKRSNHIDVDFRDEKIRTSKKIWEFESCEGEIGNAIYSDPTTDDENIYFSSWNGDIYSLSLKTKEKVWNTTIGWSSESSPVITNDKLIIGSSNGLFALNKENGNIIWENEIGAVSTKAFLDDRFVYIGSHDSKFYKIDLTNGNIKWSFDTNAEIHSSPNIKENKILFGSNDGYLYCLDKNNGNLLWKYKTDSAIWSKPNIYKNKVFFGSWDSNLYCLDLKDGRFNWKFTTGWGIDSSASIKNDNIYFGSQDNNFYSIDLNGDLKWVFKTLGGISSSPNVYGEYVFFGSSDGKIYALNKTDGSLVWSDAPDYHVQGIYNFRTKPIVSSPHLKEGKLYVASTNGNIYSYESFTYEDIEENDRKDIDISLGTWLFLIIPLLFVILVTAGYLIFSRRRYI